MCVCVCVCVCVCKTIISEWIYSQLMLAEEKLKTMRS